MAVGEVRQNLRAPGSPQETVAPRAAQDTEDARANEEVAGGGAQVVEHVAREEVPVVAKPGRQPDEDLATLFGGLAADCKVEQVQARRPAARLAGQVGDLLGGELVTVVPTEQLFDLPRAEAKVLGSELEHLVVDPELGDVQPERLATGEEDVHPRREVLDELDEDPLGRGPREHVGVVDDEQVRWTVDSLHRGQELRKRPGRRARRARGWRTRTPRPGGPPDPARRASPGPPGTTRCAGDARPPVRIRRGAWSCPNRRGRSAR